MTKRMVQIASTAVMLTGLAVVGCGKKDEAPAITSRQPAPPPATVSPSTGSPTVTPAMQQPVAVTTPSANGPVMGSDSGSIAGGKQGVHVRAAGKGGSGKMTQAMPSPNPEQDTKDLEAAMKASGLK